jgi:hypothetical protein
VGTQGDTGGEPARVYASAGEGDVLCSNAYALILGELVKRIACVDA